MSGHPGRPRIAASAQLSYRLAGIGYRQQLEDNVVEVDRWCDGQVSSVAAIFRAIHPQRRKSAKTAAPAATAANTPFTQVSTYTRRDSV